MLARPLQLDEGEVGAWYASIDRFANVADLDDTVRTWLTPAERERHGRFHREEDRRMFLLGRMLARSLVGAALGVPPAGWLWREGPHGRPEVAAPATSLHFNLAHSGGLVLCAIAWGRQVGVDVEDLGRRPVERAVVDRYCSPPEIADITAHGEGWHDRFLRYWTLKEAYLKARGLGIAVPLAELSFALDGHRARVRFLGSLSGGDDRWAFFLAQPTDRHVIAVAASTGDGVEPGFVVRPVPPDLLA